MKKTLLISLCFSVISTTAFTTTYMKVKKKSGEFFLYNVTNIERIDFSDSPSEDPNPGVTVSGEYKNHSYVNLGLPSGRLWATCNLGASKATEFGNYYAWGEIEPKTSYSSSNYVWADLSKYCTNSRYGEDDGKSKLSYGDDAASMNWGGGWRMPTSDEVDELEAGCIWQWTDDFNGTGVAGQIGTSVTNGNIIFLPAAGYIMGDTPSSVGTNGYYWSSWLYEYNPYKSFVMKLDEDYPFSSTEDRAIGCTVRAIM